MEQLVRFHDFEKGECPAILRPKEIQMCGVFPTLETVSRDCVPAGQSEVEPFSGNAWQETNGRGNFFHILAYVFRLRLPNSVATRTPMFVSKYSVIREESGN